MSQALEAYIAKPLIGTDEAVIDDKGRILFGKKKRERLGDNFTIALGAVGCLVAYPQPIWIEMVREMMQYSRINQGREQYTRLVMGLAEDDLKFDAQGRVVIPQKMRDLAKLNDKILIVGCGDRVEIWARDEWEQYSEDPEGYGQQRRDAIEKAHGRMVGF